ncbi:MAG: metallophosphoesterase [Clostridiales Family XIII bacterium]|nr:metallophosphoesterase [Clostridiales Family XIII bacterium]
MLKKISFIVVTILLCGGVLAGSALVAFETARISDTIAGVPVEVSPEFGHAITIDLGAPGRIMLTPSDAEQIQREASDLFIQTNISLGIQYLPIGVRIRILDISPTSMLKIVAPGSASFKSDDVGQLLGSFTGEFDRIAKRLKSDMLDRFILFAAGGFVFLAILFYLRRKISWRKSAVRLALVAGLCVCIIVFGVTAGLSSIVGHSGIPEDLEEPANNIANPQRFVLDFDIGTLVFDGVISLAAGKINDVYTDTSRRGWEFSEKAVLGVRDALSDPGYHERYPEEMFIQVTDIHDNLYMYPVIAQIIRETKASYVLDTGDVTKTGSSIEGYFVSEYVKSLQAAGVKEIFYIRGNHDTLTTDRQMADAGATVLDGRTDITVTPLGTVIAGYGDPLHTEFAASIHTAERTAALTALDKTIFEDLKFYTEDEESPGNRVDILMTHSPNVGKLARGAGLARIQLAGHEHVPELIITPGSTTLFNGNNTNGETQTGQNEMFGTGVGPIRRPVTVLILMRNHYTEDFRYFTVTIQPNGTVSASTIKRLP